MTKLALSLCCLFLLSFGPMVQPAAAAEECTEARLEELTGVMFDVMMEHPKSGDHLEEETAKIEAEYGGQPSDAETCEAFEKLIKALEQY
jgi:hypothetical protein